MAPAATGRISAADRADFVPSWVGLGECLLHQGAWEQAEAVAVRLESLRDGLLEAALLRGRGHLARREFAAARALLEAACLRYPLALPPRVLLSHVLLQENKDLAGAEKALRAVLELDPANAEARHNLALLLKARQEADGLTHRLGMCSVMLLPPGHGAS
jgi:tetratricopeptide (TPR) repeat protein